MNVRRLNLDYVKHTNRTAWLRWLLLGVALVFAADVADGYLGLSDEITRREQQAAHVPGASRDTESPDISRTLPGEEEMTSARDTIRRLAMPWNALFQTLEVSQTDGAALLSIEPHPDTASLVLTGQARDYLHLLSYVSALASSRNLTGAYLLRHELKSNNMQLPVAFSISAKWKE